jgi:hypothetical protein
MARVSRPDLGLWRRRALTIPPTSLDDWLHLAIWEMWMGALLCIVVGFGIMLIVTSPDGIYEMTDLSRCYGPPPVTLPCERVVYRGGGLNLAFMALFGFMLLAVAGWFLWELWNAVEPRPITDDFLKLLNDSFGRDWRNPLTWPWSRALWAYGFTAVGVMLTVIVAVVISNFVASAQFTRAPAPRVETSQRFSVGAP